MSQYEEVDRGDDVELQSLNDPEQPPVPKESGSVVEHQVPRTATVATSTFNLANTIIGAGVLGLPFAFMKTGVLLGVVLMLTMGLLMLFTLHIMARCAELTGVETYENLGWFTYKRKGAVMVQLCIIAINFGSCIAYIVIVRDMTFSVFRLVLPAGNILLNCFFYMILVTLVLMLPLALLKHLNWLSFTSFLSLVLVLFFMVVVMLRFGTLHGELSRGVLRYAIFDKSIFLAIPIFAFAYSCETSLYPVYNELKEPSVRKIDGISTLSVGAAFTVYALVAVFGYATFAENTGGNLLNSYGSNDVLLMVTRLAFAVTIIFTFPLGTFPCRRALDSLLFFGREYSYKRLFFETIAIVLAALMCAILVPDVSVVFDITGSTASMFTSYILPSAFFLRAVAITKKQVSRYERFGAIGMICIGVILGIISTALTIYDIVEGGATNKSCIGT